jgi:glycosyltransferase involved in cell wall biosynthesis
VNTTRDGPTIDKPLLVIVGPLPPPVHGVAISTSLALRNSLLRESFQLEHLDTTDRRSIENLGRWDLPNIVLGLRAALRLLAKLRTRDGILYLPLSESAGGFLRDSIFVHLAARRGWKIALHIRNSTFRDFYEERGFLYRVWIRFTLRQITGLAVLGNSLRNLFDGLVSKEIVSVVPNGTPDANTDVEPKRNRVLYLSNLSRKKGIDHAVETAFLVREGSDRAEFIFAGEWESDDVRHEIRQRIGSDGNRIEFLPPISGAAKDELLASAWVLLFPVAWGEGHPRILLEALAAGVPVVTTDRATIADTVVDGEAGFVLPDPEPAALAKKILLLLDDPYLRERMSRAARKRYLKHFTQDRADRLLADWLTVVAERRGRTRGD